MSEAEKLRCRGNAAFDTGKFKEAVQFYTEGIALAPDYELLYSNRSAAYCKLGQYSEALQDAEDVIRIKPDWLKGYARKGAALAFMNRHSEAILAYIKALEEEPHNEQLKKAIGDSMAQLTGPAEEALFMNPFADARIWEKLEADARTKELLNDPEYKQIIEALHSNSNKDMSAYLNDAHVMTTLATILGRPIDMETKDDLDVEYAEDEKKLEMKLKCEEKMIRKDKEEAAAKEKELGNEAYKKKDFQVALIHYGRAIELDPTNIIYRNNQAAVFFEQNDYDRCIKTGLDAIDIGLANEADKKFIASALARVKKAYYKKEADKNPLKFYDAISEQSAPNIVENSQKVIDEEQSLKENHLGNSFFQRGDYPSAMKHYSEAIKLNPEDAKLYSNRAACYTKLAEFSMAVQDCDECLRRDPKFGQQFVQFSQFLLEQIRRFNNEELTMLLTPRQLFEEKIRRQKLQEAADLELAVKAFGARSHPYNNPFSASTTPWLASTTRPGTAGKRVAKQVKRSKRRKTNVASRPYVNEQPQQLDAKDCVIFLDVDNWQGHVDILLSSISSRTIVWVFQGGATNWQEPLVEPYVGARQRGAICLAPPCGTSQDAADFAIAYHIGLLDGQLPKHIPFVVLSGDRGFIEVENQVKSRKLAVVSPHHVDTEKLSVLLRSVIDK